MNKIENAQIKSTMLGKEDHGILTFYLMVEFDGGGCGFGGYSLDQYDADQKKRLATAIGFQSLVAVMECVGVSKWEDLPGKYIRVEHTGWGGTITRIGNLIKDKWFSLTEFFEAWEAREQEEE